jgi:peptidyl-prolyl cis-trans isomerase SurA
MKSHRPAGYLSGVCCLGLLVVLVSCSPRASDSIVAKVGDNAITLPEYEALYIKSNGSRELAVASTQEERVKFLALMTKFKLKLADAYRRGLDKNPDVRKEIEQYRGSLAASYLTEREVTAPGVRRLFERRQEEIRASHILLSLKPQAPDSETQAVYAKAHEIIALLKGGANFSALALEHSQDPSVKANKGDLYYFTAGQMVPPFEDAVYAMKAGAISETPIRTQYGVHVVKVTDRKPASGEIRCSHIMIRFEKQDPTPEDTLAAYNKIKAIKDSLAMGIDFAELAKRNSGDPGSASRGGDLSWFARRRWVVPFDEVAFTLKPGQLSGIVRTAYGYHLIKCLEARPPKGFEESRKELQQLYQQQSFQEDFKKYTAALKQEVKFTLNNDLLTQFIAALDSTKTPKDSAWAPGATPTLRSSALMRVGDKPVTIDSVMAIMSTRPDFSGSQLQAATVRSTIDKIAEQLVFATKSEALERQSPEFAGIMREYTDGILLYQAEQERVWNNISVSDSALHEYFSNHRDQFVYPDRVGFTEIRAANDSLARLIHAQLVSGKTIQQVAAADSVRMNAPSTIQEMFSKNSSGVSPRMAKSIARLASEVKKDAMLKIYVTVYPDTARKQAEKLAQRRLDAVKSYLAKNLGIAGDRILTSSVPPRNPSTLTAGARDSTYARVTIQVTGRTPQVLGRPTTEFLSVTADERTKRADSISVGSVSQPFGYQNTFSIVHVNKKEPSRQKTFEEAGTEVSSAFQEYESKRLETEWLDGLRKMYPVAEYRDVLKSAFTRVQ